MGMSPGKVADFFRRHMPRAQDSSIPKPQSTTVSQNKKLKVRGILISCAHI